MQGQDLDPAPGCKVYRGAVRISELADSAGVPTSTVRYYERVGLLPKPERGSSGYRSYDAHAVRRVRFIKRAQELGFTLAEIADLLAFREEAAKSCDRVESRASATVERITEKLLDDIVSGGPPVDLVPTLAMPLPSTVICRLLGVSVN